MIQPFNLVPYAISEVIGSLALFMLIGVLFIFWIGAKYRMGYRVNLLLTFLFVLIFSTFTGEWWYFAVYFIFLILGLWYKATLK